MSRAICYCNNKNWLNDSDFLNASTAASSIRNHKEVRARVEDIVFKRVENLQIEDFIGKFGGIGKYEKDISIKHLTWDIFNAEEIPLAETTTSVNGKQIPVVIFAKFSKTIYGTPATIFKVKNKSTQENLAYIEIVRTYKQKGGNYYPENRCKSERESGSLRVEMFRGEYKYIDDQAIICLLTQIAMEVFSLEPDVRLEGCSVHSQGYVYEAAGFRSPYSSNDLYLDEIKAARAEKRLFPTYKDLTMLTFYIHKWLNFSGGTKFANKSDDGRTMCPAMVDFELNSDPLTWEEYIEKNRIFQNLKKGPILPKFINRDLSKLPELAELKLQRIK